MKKSDADMDPVKPHLLIVDDEAAVCRVIANYFQKNGFKTSTAGNAADAYSMLELEPYEAIISDVKMPGEDGISLLGRVSQSWPDIPVILMTGHAQLEMAIDAIKNGAFDFVQKPFDLGYMAKIVERAVNYTRLQRLEKNYHAELEQKVARRTAELNASEARYHAIIEDQTELICRYLPDGRLTFVNGEYSRYYGISPGELIDSHFIPNIPAPDLSVVNRVLSAITSDNPVVEYTQRIITPAGDLRWQRWTQRGIYSAAGNLMEFQAVGYDITERKLTEETLLFLVQRFSRHPEEDFFESLARYLAECLDVDYVCIDRLQGDCLAARTLAVYHDGKFEDNVEYTLKDTPCGDVVGKQICVFPAGVCNLFPDDAALQDLQAESYVGTTLWSFDMKPIGLIAVISRRPLTNPSLAEAILQLVSIRAAAELERNQVMEELRKSETQISQLLQTTDQGIYGIDLDGRCTFINKSGLNILGYQLEECLGRNMHDLIHHTHPDGSPYLADDCPIFRVKSTGVGCRIDNELLWRRDGTPFTAEYSSYPMNEDGQISGGVVTFSDITERKLIEEELHHARDMAESANIAKSAFLASMSHEIRTPMNGVIGFAGVLLDTDLSEEQREYAELVRKSGENLLGLINDILDFSKIEAGKLDIEILDFDLRTTVEDTAEMLAMRAANAGLELICQINPVVPSKLKGDPGRLRQIITNLAGNAIKFTHEGEVVIIAEVESDFGESVVIRFSVRDTGIGIPKNRLAAIFTPFTQADGSTTRKYGGTGLGLTICKQLTELMGGAIGVDSVEGKGSTFWFTVFFEKQTIPDQTSSSQTSEVSKTSEVSVATNITTARILAVDVNATNRMLMTTLLNSWGCRYEAAGDGEAALKLLHKAAEENDPFRIALLDQKMPGINGLELGRRIKADPLLKSTLMIMVKSLGQRGDVAALEQIGFAGYLTKPVRQSQLYDCIGLVLERADQTSLNQTSEVLETSEVSRGLVTRHTVAESAKQGIRILLAEDNIINQKVAQTLLNKLGYKADVVADGQEAVRALELINYDLVLMDCQMPEMNGFEATAMIRSASSEVKNHAVPIIAMTANAMKKDRDECLEAGMDDYLSKPVKKDELSEVLRKWLNGGII